MVLLRIEKIKAVTVISVTIHFWPKESFISFALQLFIYHLFQDRNVITTTDAERICLTPAGLQDEIDSIVSKYTKGRSFVRPSGTEDVVRVYAEAATTKEVNALAAEVALKVYELAGGVGDKPEVPQV